MMSGGARRSRCLSGAPATGPHFERPSQRGAVRTALQLDAHAHAALDGHPHVFTQLHAGRSLEVDLEAVDAPRQRRGRAGPPP
jgi:hypothetical protein